MDALKRRTESPVRVADLPGEESEFVTASGMALDEFFEEQERDARRKARRNTGLKRF